MLQSSCRRINFVKKSSPPFRHGRLHVLTQNFHRNNSILPNPITTTNRTTNTNNTNYQYDQKQNSVNGINVNNKNVSTIIDSKNTSRISTFYRSVASSGASIKATMTKGPATKSVVENKMGTIKVFKLFAKHLWPKDNKELQTRVKLAVGCLLLSKLITVQVPYLFKHIVEALSITAEPLTAIPLALLLGYGGARMTASLTQELRNAIFSRVTQHAILNIAKTTYLHLHNLDMTFHMARDTGGLSRAIDRGTRGITFVLQSLLFHIVPTALEIGLVCGIMGYTFGPMYAAVTFCTLSFYAAFTFMVTRWRTAIRRSMNKYDNQAASLSVDSLLNYETVKYFNNEELEVDRYAKVMKKYNQSAEKVQTSLAFLNFGQNAIFSFALTVVMVMASQDIVAGALSIGDLVMINGLLFQLSLPLNFLGSVYRELKQAIVDMDILFSLGLVESKVQDPKSGAPLNYTEGSITFNNVSFKYEDEKSILNNVSFEVPGGKRVAIVGTSGGGKTTIFRLLYRFYDPNDGTISIDGQPIQDVTMGSLRSSISVVPQDLVLFNESIEYNISYGKPGCTHEEVVAAAKLAHIHSSITGMPQGYQTMVGERGLKLSGGEKQRICLARALMKEPRILLLDEVTSGLDAESENAIQKALKAVTVGRTVVMITHRLKTAQNADIIMVFDKGSIVEQGSHSELMQKQGVYANMVRMQGLLE